MLTWMSRTSGGRVRVGARFRTQHSCAARQMRSLQSMCCPTWRLYGRTPCALCRLHRQQRRLVGLCAGLVSSRITIPCKTLWRCPSKRRASYVHRMQSFIPYSRCAARTCRARRRCGGIVCSATGCVRMPVVLMMLMAVSVRARPLNVAGGVCDTCCLSARMLRRHVRALLTCGMTYSVCYRRARLHARCCAKLCCVMCMTLRLFRACVCPG